MRSALQITFRGMAPSPAFEEQVRAQVARLDSMYDGITRCHVVVEEPHRHHRQGNPFEVKVDLHVPGKEIVAKSAHAEQTNQQSAHEALMDAFDRVERQLERYIAGLRAYAV